MVSGLRTASRHTRSRFRYLRPRAARAPLNHRIEIERAGARQSRVPVAALLDDPLLRLEIAVHDSEALLKSLGPFEVVGERPQEITAPVSAGLHPPPHLEDNPPQKADASLVVDLAVGARPVAVRASVLGHVDRNT